MKSGKEGSLLTSQAISARAREVTVRDSYKAEGGVVEGQGKDKAEGSQGRKARKWHNLGRHLLSLYIFGQSIETLAGRRVGAWVGQLHVQSVEGWVLRLVSWSVSWSKSW